MECQESAKRQVAHKVCVADLLNNRYVKEDGWLPNYVAVGEKKVSRVNLLGVLVSKISQGADVPVTSFVLDDGSGRVSLRFFESNALFDIGDVVFVIGRPREFGAERYVVPEVMKKVSDSKWISVRKMELAKGRQDAIKAGAPEAADDNDGKLAVETEDLAGDSSPSSRLVGAIRGLDSGEGVDYGLLAERFGSDAEHLLKRLLEQGDIFEVKPGRYKVLE
jgi:RPA family protein